MIINKYIVPAIALAILLFATTALAKTKYPLLDELFALSEDQIDIGIVALKLAKDIYPNLDIQAYSIKIDNLAKRAKLITAYSSDQADPEYRIRALNTYLYKSYKLEYDLTDPMAKKPVNRYLNGILDTKKGSCVTMPLLYMAVAQRLDYPVYPVVLPTHLILRYSDPSVKLQNIEATSGGGYVPDDEYIHVLSISKQGIRSGAYMRTLSYREFVGELLAQNGIYWGMKGDTARAIAYLEAAAILFPKGAEIHYNLGTLYKAFYKKNWNMSSGILAMQKAQIAYIQADNLGITLLRGSNYLIQQQKAQAEHRRRQGGTK